MSNPVEGQKLTTSAYQQKIADAIAQGVDKFLGKTDETPLAKVQSSKLAAKGVEGNR